MGPSLKPYKGSRDFYPADLRFRKEVFGEFSRILETYAFQSYDGPMLEEVALYEAKSGEELVSQQLYSFEDRGGRRVAIRPEMTPTLARMVAAKFDEIPKPIRWYSIPNLWRYERPQRGRLREHWQLNVDIMGGDNDKADREILSVAAEMMDRFEALPKLRFRLNHRGVLNALFEKMGLKEEASIRLLKLLDAREKMKREQYEEQLQSLSLSSEQLSLLDRYLAASLEGLAEFLPSAEVDSLTGVIALLRSRFPQGNFEYDSSIVRGLDYYTGLIFEVFDLSPENPRAIFGGGRYDNLVGMFHAKKSLSGVGFGMGDVVFSQFLETHDLLPPAPEREGVFFAISSPEVEEKALELASSLRRSGCKVKMGLEYQGFKQALKQANRHASQFAVLTGEEEWARSSVLVKNLSSGEQSEVAFSNLTGFFSGIDSDES